MRSPIQDANAGAAMDVAPTRKHAVRTATIAKQNNSGAIQRQQQINAISSTLGNALGNFMEGKRKTENEQRYMKAYHDQGTAEGLSEFQKDMKNTGFTELIYGGQTPEYQGALDASARNASNAMYIEETDFIEAGGGDLTPDQYREHMQDKLTDYNTLNFSDAPDAAFAFMRNWQENSNELSKQQVKLYKVRQQEKARLTVAEGFQTDFDLYKKVVGTNPNRAIQIGKDMYSGKYKPVGMSPTSYREVIVQESFTAIRAHDYTALKLLNESGISSTFNDKEWKQYEQVRNIIDTDNFDILESERLKYQTLLTSENPKPKQVETALAQYTSARQQAAARDTGTAKHLKTVYGADRWRGAIGKQYQERLAKEAQLRIDARVEEVEYNSDVFEFTLKRANSEDRRDLLADRLGDLLIASEDPTLDREVRADLMDQFVKGKEILEDWDSAQETEAAKDQAILDKAELREKELRVGVDYLKNGKGYYSYDAKSQKQHLEAAISGIVRQILPNSTLSEGEQLVQVLANPMLTRQLTDTTGKFAPFLKDSKAIKTAIGNIGVQLRATNPDDQYTEVQIQQSAALAILRAQNPALYWAAYPSIDDRREILTITDAINSKANISLTNNKIDANIAASDNPNIGKLSSSQVLEKLGLANADHAAQVKGVTEYNGLVNALGSTKALNGARLAMSDNTPTIQGMQIKDGGTFDNVGDADLQQVLDTLSISYVSGGVPKSGLTRVLGALVKNTSTKGGATLFRMDQVPGLQVSIHDKKTIVLELNGRRSMLNIDEIEGELNGYTRRRNWRGFNTTRR